MLIPKHCSNPKCHRPYIGKDNIDRYCDVLVKLSTEPQIRVVSICKECRKDFDMIMARDVLKDVMEVELRQVMDDPLITNKSKVSKIDAMTNYTIQAIAINIDEMNKKIYDKNVG